MPSTVRRYRRLGVSVVELLIASALIGVVLAGTWSVLVAAFRHQRESDVAAEVHTAALAAITQLEREVKESHRAGYQLFDTPSGIVFASVRTADGAVEYDPDSRRVLWQRWVCYYLEPSTHGSLLIRKDEALPAPTPDPPSVPANRSVAYFRSSTGSGKAVAREVSSLAFDEGESLGIRLTCGGAAHRGTSTEAEFLVEMRSRVAFRN